MQHEIQKYLYDIKVAIASIQEYIENTPDFSSFQSNKLVKRAVEREFEIIGEAANRIRKLDSEIAIPDARKIIDLRNWVIHGYDKVDDAILWGVIRKYLPSLKTQIEALMSEFEGK